MTTLIHVLGSDLPHHNQTVLTFFNDVICQEMAPSQKPHFMVVSQDAQLAAAYPKLEIEVFDSKNRLPIVLFVALKQSAARAFSSMGNLMRQSG